MAAFAFRRLAAFAVSFALLLMSSSLQAAHANGAAPAIVGNAVGNVQARAKNEPGLVPRSNGTAAPIAPQTAGAGDPCRSEATALTLELCAARRGAAAGEDSARWSFFQMILSAAGLLGLLVTLYYTRVATNSAAAANAETAIALELAKRDAEAAEALVELSEGNAARELRAYLDFQEMRGTSDPSGDNLEKGKLGLRIKLTNYGRTPGTEIIMNYTIYHSPKGQPEDRTKHCEDSVNVGVVAPTDHCGYNFSMMMPLAVALDIRAGVRILQVEISAEYEDVFGQPHRIVSLFEGSTFENFGVVDGTRSWS